MKLLVIKKVLLLILSFYYVHNSIPAYEWVLINGTFFITDNIMLLSNDHA